MLGDERRQFGSFLRKLRVRKHLTLRALSAAANVPFPNISAMECGRLGAGRIVARKLATGLGLRGQAKKAFLTYAAITNSRDRVAKELLAYPGILVNVLPSMLRDARIMPRDILFARCENPEIIHHPSSDSMELADHLRLKPELEQYLRREGGPGTCIVIFLKGGRQVVLRCQWLMF
jgi:transcriptional regulator with XRE-family HTH domain